MQNPWNEIHLSDYEKHMSLNSVLQLQTLNEMMRGQLTAYPVSSVMILGIAGGNGLCHVDPARIRKVYGVDVNESYLEECRSRYPELDGLFLPVCADLRDRGLVLPAADLVVANLLIEYIGYGNFQKVIQTVKPCYVSCAIQIDSGSDFVSDSPYLHVFDRLDEVHCQMDETELCRSMQQIYYKTIDREEFPLPNGKKLVRLDFQQHTQSTWEKCQVQRRNDE